MYSIKEAAQYAGVPAATLQAWTRGYRIGPHFYGPVLHLPRAEPPMLSFANLLETHILNALRKHGLSLQQIRRGLEYVYQEFPARHPLLDREFQTDGCSLFIAHLGKLIDVSKRGQLALEQRLEAHLRRIERDAAGFPSKLYPFTRTGPEIDGPRMVVISPGVAFGRPVLAGTGIPVEEITGRHKAGESIRDLADDYETTPQAIEEAIRFREAA